MNRLREIREKHGLTLEEFGKIVGKSKVAAFDWENEIHPLSVADLITISQHFNLSTDYILGIDSREKIVGEVAAELEKIDFHTIITCIKKNLLNLK